jgi:glucokinase
VSERSHYLGVDLGGTKILAGVVSAAGEILSRAKRATPFRSRGATLTEALSEAIEEALESARISQEQLAAIGMGSPGPLDPERGIILRTPNIAVRNLPVGRLLSRRFGAPLVIDNDVHMAVFGELRAGAARGRQSVVGLWIGTGVGGAVVLDGRLVHGANGNAGELGHMILHGKKAAGGQGRGTLEWEASKTGIARRMRKEVARGQKTTLAKHLARGGERLHSGDLARACRSGDRLALKAVAHSARYVGIAVANLFDALAPELFVLGGGVVEALGQDYLSAVRQSANEFVFTTDLAPVRIAAAKLGDDAGLLGAALAAREKHPVDAEPASSGAHT